jgi:HAD superfamily hydrolase (TIGR01484 family)
VRYHVLACDYDHTLAWAGRVGPATVETLRRLRQTGRKLVLVTGRLLNEVLGLCPELELFDRVVAENGAVLYRPARREEHVLAGGVTPGFLEALQARGVNPLAAGRSIVATCEPHETTVLEVIKDLGLELHVIFNKGSVMVLPSGVNKATGLAAALQEMGLSPRNCVGIGDAENDHAFLGLCECAVAVANALPAVLEKVDLVTGGEDGAGVVELIERLIAGDLGDLEPRLARHHVPLATGPAGEEIRIPPYGVNVLIGGASGSGKSTVATAFLENLIERGYQVCVIDPEGDYTGWEGAIALGDQNRPPTIAEILEVLEAPSRNASVNLLGVSLKDRPAFFDGLLPRLQELRARTGRPHWIVVDEAHHMLPPAWRPGALTQPKELQGLLLITVHPEHVAPDLLATIAWIIGVGSEAAQVIQAFAAAAKDPVPAIGEVPAEPGLALLWHRRNGAPPKAVRPLAPRAERRRHLRKYAEGELGPDRSFYFRGPEGKLNLRAHNLAIFLQLAEGVDDETWRHHLAQGDYSRWFRDSIKDEGLAEEAAGVERRLDLEPAETRTRIRSAIERRYTAPS